MEILAIIPARIGSKRLPMKNIRILGNHPLLEYTIKSAQNSNLIQKIILSTDDPKIAKIGKSLGIEVPFLRPKKYATDKSTSMDVVKNVLEYLEKNSSYIPDIVLLLSPTTPFRTNDLIDKSIKKLKNSNATSVISVKEIETHLFASFWKNGKFLKPYKSSYKKYLKSQNRPKLFFPTGAVYTCWYNTIKKHNSFFGPKPIPLIIKDESKNIDIDTEYDLFIAEMTLKYWEKFKKL